VVQRVSVVMLTVCGPACQCGVCVVQSVGTNESLSALVDGLPAMLYRQYAYEEPIVRSGRHLMHSAFFKVCVILMAVTSSDCTYFQTPSENQPVQFACI